MSPPFPHLPPLPPGAAALCEQALCGPSSLVLRRAAGGACLLATAATSLASLAFPWFKLPPPTGPHRVGRLTCVQADPSRGAWVTPEKGTPRRLLVDVWYPADTATHGAAGTAACVYMDSVLARAMSASFLGPRMGFVGSHFARVPTASRRGAAAAAGAFPVLVFSHGNVSTRVQNTSLLEELARCGKRTGHALTGQA
jgi:hypothetical protein